MHVHIFYNFMTNKSVMTFHMSIKYLSVCLCLYTHIFIYYASFVFRAALVFLWQKYGIPNNGVSSEISVIGIWPLYCYYTCGSTATTRGKNSEF